MEIGLKEVMEQGLDDFNEFHKDSFGEEGNNLTLFTVTQEDFTQYYIMGQLSVEELMQQFKEADHPLVDMDGGKIGIEYFAWLEQSDKVSLSVRANMDEDLLEIYEINGILEENRTDSNTHIWETGLAEYINGFNKNEKEYESYREQALALMKKYGFETYNMDNPQVDLSRSSLPSSAVVIVKEDLPLSFNEWKDVKNYFEEVDRLAADKSFEQLQNLREQNFGSEDSVQYELAMDAHRLAREKGEKKAELPFTDIETEKGNEEEKDDLQHTHTLIIQKNDDEVVEKIELEIMLGAISNEDISKINALNNKYPDLLSYTLLDGESVILASGAVTPELGDRINVIEDKVYDLQERYSYSVLIDEEALKALDRFQASEYPLNHFQEENEMTESFIIWSDNGKNPSEFVLYNPISEKYYHLIPSKDVMEVSNTIRMAEQYMPKEQIERFDSVRLGLPDKNAEKVKEFKEITLKFGKGCVGDEFKGRDGTAYRQILVPNVDKNDSRPWQTFVVKSNAVHKDKFGKGMWIKLPEDGHTTLKRTVVVGEKPDGKKEWGVEKTRVSNADLKKMVESYKEKSKPSLTGKLVNKNAEAKQENAGKQQDKDIKEKSTKKDLS